MWQRLLRFAKMWLVMDILIRLKVTAYIAGDTEEEQLRNLEEVINRLKKAGLKLNSLL